jgi:hypothetical protein
MDLAVSLGWNATTLYTFGEPRVGNAAYVTYYHSVIAAAANGAGAYRVVHWADPVPHVPLELMVHPHLTSPHLTSPHL